ncbi:MAG: DUF2288 domain-containing protein [Gammaproteobacteria bacterium]|jgi:hypothetical protein|nr:DUF2288 domain-containing protein [Gammaproteobacteria bacterium]
MNSSDDTLNQPLKEQLNRETGQIAWPELQRHFARGVVIVVGPELDLIEVAIKFVKDDKSAIEAWLNSGQISRARDENAHSWAQATTVFWAVVVAPWVLVQETKQ